MTYKKRQSCIYTIQTLRRLALNIHGVIDVVDDMNCNELIRLLQTEHCEDAISRQAVLDKAKYWIAMQETKTGFIEKRGYFVDADDIKALPSVQPEPFINKPCVSEQACHEDKMKVLEKIKAEIEQDAFKDVNGSKYISVNRVNQIINKYTEEVMDDD